MCKKEPITSDIIEKVYDALYKEDDLYNLRTICAILVAYAGFLRSQELLAIRRSDIIFENCYMSIFTEKSKTDIYGAWVVIAKTNSKLCPVLNLINFVKLLGIEDDNSKQYIYVISVHVNLDKN